MSDDAPIPMTHPQQQLIDDNEGLTLRRLSDILTGGNAATWDEVFDAAERAAALSAGAVPQPDKWAEFLAEWVDFNREKGTSAEAWEAFMEQEHQHPPVAGCKCKICVAAGAVPQQEPQEREVLAALKAIVYSAHPSKRDNPEMFQAWQLAHAVISRAEQPAVPALPAPQEQTLPDFWRCRACGCLWRDNHDGSVSLGSAKQTSCPECELKPTPIACDPLVCTPTCGTHGPMHLIFASWRCYTCNSVDELAEPVSKPITEGDADVLARLSRVVHPEHVLPTLEEPNVEQVRVRLTRAQFDLIADGHFTIVDEHGNTVENIWQAPKDGNGPVRD